MTVRIFQGRVVEIEAGPPGEVATRCAGKTQDGEQCKRVRFARYCPAHAWQDRQS